jgi:hypothetical protein
LKDFASSYFDFWAQSNGQTEILEMLQNMHKNKEFRKQFENYSGKQVSPILIELLVQELPTLFTYRTARAPVGTLNQSKKKGISIL